MISYSETAVGESLRECRSASGLSLHEAAAFCSIPLTYMLKIEAGSSGPTAEVLRQLIRLYAPEVGAPLPLLEGEERRKPTRSDCEIDWVGLVRHAHDRSNRDILDEVAAGVRALRGFGAAIPVIMREVEADIMISLLDTNNTRLHLDIMESFSLTSSQANDLINSATRRFERRGGRRESVVEDASLAASSSLF